MSKAVLPWSIAYRTGNVFDAPEDGPRIVVFMTNDSTPTWGGGFAKQVAIRHGNVQAQFRAIARLNHRALSLGSVHLLEADGDLYFAPIVAQRGVGRSREPRIQYPALVQALKELAREARRKRASVHMPRIGTGGAGGRWDLIEGMILEHLCGATNVFVYDLPSKARRRAKPAKNATDSTYDDRSGRAAVAEA